MQKVDLTPEEEDYMLEDGMEEYYNRKAREKKHD